MFDTKDQALVKISGMNKARMLYVCMIFLRQVVLTGVQNNDGKMNTVEQYVVK